VISHDRDSVLVTIFVVLVHITDTLVAQVQFIFLSLC